MDYSKNYAHVPFKKRPMTVIDDDQPQDLSVKRRKIENDHNSKAISSEPRVIATPPPSPPRSPAQGSIPGSFPRLADYYLRLFQSSALPTNLYHQSSARSDQTNIWFRPSIIDDAQHPMNLYKPSFQVPAPHRKPLEQKECQTRVPPTMASLMSPSSEAQLSSPRSISSEDSGLGLSEEEDQIDPNTRFSCEHCRKTYSTDAGLSKHKQLHCPSLAQKAFECKQCPKTYTTSGALKMHVRTHTLPCKCDICGKAFSRPWLLQGHIRTHTGEKPFQCQQCDRSFADRSNLRAHLQTHAQIKKYACTGCSKTFSRMSLLNKHTETACPGNSH